MRSYIPHFLNTPGYVYAYAFGELLVMALYNLYRTEGASFVPKYEALLAAGNSNYPDKLLAEISMTSTIPPSGMKVSPHCARWLKRKKRWHTSSSRIASARNHW